MYKQKVVVFLPAYNEEKSIADVIQEVPRSFHPLVEVKVIVINDGSTDRTVEVAELAGADEVIHMEKNSGLGAAVRRGLQECLRLGADIGVMIDADAEYPARSIPSLLQPIFEGEADYTMGSRFLGTIKGMRLHRRLGNYCFTLLQSILLRKWLHDGQSGMRAFSKQVMEHAEIIHDYNYAQVITLNIVRKGFRVKEIPIQYQVRTKGQSFIKFKAYMTNVIPAIYKEMRRPVDRIHIQKDQHKMAEFKENEILKNSD
ncbi:glycosyltransferase involved in cell wall biosynthesis [Oikeobacillus pervagus]|uniref:Glycosyltransferase involved in cell wall biosynthesis n=1 Tax=Oikeobacillus pervagus TaxID=1325931 RepID=A0AAJ1T268_9BACI|nr:glycosyltransferase family 2 protein [Oikeobacillus pervagus]MDQ0215437.1 glycosyltransferase involved in cell wall biosynthesis [Oikeobacillus pervagus]